MILIGQFFVVRSPGSMCKSFNIISKCNQHMYRQYKLETDDNTGRCEQGNGCERKPRKKIKITF